MNSDRVRVLIGEQGVNLLVLGTVQHIKLTGAETEGAYTLLEESGPVGSGVPEHVHHSEDETYFVLKGTYEFTVGGKTLRAGAGTMVFAPRQVPHSMEVVGDVPAKVLTLISPPGLERMFEDLSQLGGDAEPDEVGAICRKYGVEFV